MSRPPVTLIRRIAIATYVLAVVIATAWSSGGNAEARQIKNPVKATPASIKTGEAVFKKYCAFCHNADGTGDGPLAPKGSHPPSLVDDKWDHGTADGDLFAVIQNGAGPTSAMKPFKGKLADQDIWHVINYVRSLASNKTS